MHITRVFASGDDSLRVISLHLHEVEESATRDNHITFKQEYSGKDEA